MPSKFEAVLRRALGPVLSLSVYPLKGGIVRERRKEVIQNT